jgi:NAD(P)-dependent dehydrogenase (short-subunit alcohol dehydrogenase family)
MSVRTLESLRPLSLYSPGVGTRRLPDIAPIVTDRFAGKRALVTGGASGIGLATAQRLEAEGARVAILGRDAPIRADVRDEAQVEAGVRAAVAELGGLDIVIHSAGVYRYLPFLEIKVEDWDDMIAVNLRGTFLVGRAAARALVDQGTGGTIVNLSSIAAIRSDATEPPAHYNASKAGVLSLTKQMAAELAIHRIRVNAVLPGPIDTPMLTMMENPESAAAWLENAVPLKRVGQPEEVAALICFLASDEAAYITGVGYLCDGGAAVY